MVHTYIVCLKLACRRPNLKYGPRLVNTTQREIFIDLQQLPTSKVICQFRTLLKTKTVRPKQNMSFVDSGSLSIQPPGKTLVRIPQAVHTRIRSRRQVRAWQLEQLALLDQLAAAVGMLSKSQQD